jgi:phosphoesterase RecJ-like protein
MKQLIQQIKRSHSICLVSHINPDGDAIGSLLAMGLALDALNVNTTLYNETPLPAVYRFLPHVQRIQQQVHDGNSYDTAIVLDCGNLDRVGNHFSTLLEVPIIINIDHHITNTRFGDFQLIDHQACATAEIVYRLIKAMGVPISQAIATSIYTGIVTDTGSFRFANTNRAAFSICNEMVQLGVKPYHVAKHLYGTYSLGRIKLLNLALDSIEISKNGSFSVMTLTQDMLEETGTHTEDADGLINYARRIEDVKVAALIQERSQGNNHPQRKYHVSLRSDGSVDVAAIASKFGGGGHPSAAGFSIESTLAGIKTTIKELAEFI